MAADTALDLGVHEWRDAVLEAERNGELLLAFDRAERALALHPSDRWLQHRAVLALARAGSTDEAERRFDAYGLADVHDEDAAALGARIAKDRALAAEGSERIRRARIAADGYHDVFRRTNGYYSAINAATMSLVAGDRDGARALAGQALDLATSDESYYAAATEAEGHLLRGEVDAAHDALVRAASLAQGDYSAVATTRRQLRLICRMERLDEAILEALTNPGIVHYSGHRLSGPAPLDDEAEQRVAHEIAAVLDARSVGFAFGSLAAGADILWAEAVLARGATLEVVLPFTRDEFLETSVLPSGDGWAARYVSCLEQAAAVHFATEDAYLGDDVLYRYAAELAMGLTILRAQHLDSPVQQLAVWDGLPARGEAGTAVDVATWRRRGLLTTVIELERPTSLDGTAPPPGAGRVVRALLFGDLKGFSNLSDAALPAFVEHVLGGFARVLDDYGDAVCHRNTWGDGLYVVLRDASTAADVALELQSCVRRVVRDGGVAAELGLRVGAHLGPVFPIQDPVLGTQSFMGAHVSRTARIEPVTPEGSVFVTDRFAASLQLEDSSGFACEYVGHMPAAKDYGRLRMYRLVPLQRLRATAS
jgi:hypothetical protein